MKQECQTLFSYFSNLNVQSHRISGKYPAFRLGNRPSRTLRQSIVALDDDRNMYKVKCFIDYLYMSVERQHQLHVVLENIVYVDHYASSRLIVKSSQWENVVGLTQLLNQMSVCGYPPLVEIQFYLDVNYVRVIHQISILSEHF